MSSEFVVIVKRPYTTIEPVPVNLKTDSAFDGTSELTRSKDIIDFSLTAGGPVLKFDGADNKFPGAKLSAGFPLFAVAKQPSVNMNDVVINSGAFGVVKQGHVAAVGQAESADLDPNDENFCDYGTNEKCLPTLWEGHATIQLPTLAGRHGKYCHMDQRHWSGCRHIRYLREQFDSSDCVRSACRALG